MAKRLLTDRTLRALRPARPGTRYDVMDTEVRGLGVRVTDKAGQGGRAAQRTFVLYARYPGGGGPTRRRLGDYPSMELASAREKARTWNELIDKGVDPREDELRREREADEARLRQGAEAEVRERGRFGVVVEDYLRRRVSKQRKARDVEREIRNEIVPAWRDKLVTEITRQDVVDLVSAIADRPAPAHAHNVFGHIRTFYNWAIGAGVCGLETSPCDRLRPGKLIGPKAVRQRTLSDDELFALWRAAGRLGYPFGPLCRLLALTGARKTEVAGARWREFAPELVRLLRARKPDDDPIDWRAVPASAKTWTVPAERFKSDAEHLVPLTDEACEVLESLPMFRGGDHLFSYSAGRTPIGGFGKPKRRLDRRMLRTLRALARTRGDDPDAATLSPFVLHDVRRTVRTRLSSLRVEERVAEMVIGHGKRGLGRVYDQHQYAQEMREALEQWAAKLRSLVRPERDDHNVVELRA